MLRCVVAHCDTQHEPPSSPRTQSIRPREAVARGAHAELQQGVASASMGTWDPGSPAGAAKVPTHPGGSAKASGAQGTGWAFPFADSTTRLREPVLAPAGCTASFRVTPPRPPQPLPRGQFWGPHPCWGLGAGVTAALAGVPTLVLHPVTAQPSGLGFGLSETPLPGEPLSPLPVSSSSPDPGSLKMPLS